MSVRGNYFNVYEGFYLKNKIFAYEWSFYQVRPDTENIFTLFVVPIVEIVHQHGKTSIWLVSSFKNNLKNI